ncbi:MAG: hypothetical protein LLG05_11615 [Porphyromonadaceae bacterium]|nr:hypothetical protein [Porphyromonadaceae bacterium]
MKNFYIECAVKYTEFIDGNPIEDTEYFESIVSANSKKAAENIAKKEALDRFNDELNDGYSNVSVKIEYSYETSGDARI